MATVSTPPGQEKQFGATARRYAWWLGPLLTFLGLLAFLIYANWIVFLVPGYFEIRRDPADFFKPDNPAVAPYLAPFHSPLIYDAQSHHAWIQAQQPGWWHGGTLARWPVELMMPGRNRGGHAGVPGRFQIGNLWPRPAPGCR